MGDSARRALVASVPALTVAGVIALLGLVLDHGPARGLSPGWLEGVGRLRFALLVGAPLLVYPIAFVRGERAIVRVGLSLLPGLLWWLGEVELRGRDHGLAEALWLAASPLNQLHLLASGVAVALADTGCRLAAWARGRPRPRRGRARVAAGAVALLGAPLVIGAGVFPYLQGYHALFQADLLPRPATRPGPLDADAVPAAGAGDRRPNLLVILSDDHRADFLAHAGHPFVETPALDRLADEGVRMTRAYVTSSLCSPSRATLLTGMRPEEHGVWNNFTAWSDDNRTFFEYLAPRGYRTAFIGKWHMPGGLPDLRGVDHFVTFTALGGQGVYEDCPLVVDGEETPSRRRYIAGELTDRAIEWIEAGDGSPFALLLSHKNVHADFTPDEPERGRYADRPIRWPEGAHPWTHFTDGQYVHVNPLPLDDSIRRYAEAVTSMDREIGRLLDRLDALGLAEDTLVVYTSDNGYLWGEHGLVDKRWAYEESIRVPLIVRAPGAGRAAGRTVDRLVTNLDLAPTLLDAAGLAPPEAMPGRSLLPWLGPGARAPEDWRDAFVYTYWFEPPYPTPTQHALVTGRYKYVEYAGRPPSLFDLEVDPREADDLAARPEAAALRARLARRLAAMRSAGAGGAGAPTPAAR